MPVVSINIQINSPSAVVYHYLRERYNRNVHRSTSLGTKGYVPAVTCIEAVETDEYCRITYAVPARDPLLGIFLSGWRWTYEIEPAGPQATSVTIRYDWSWFMAILGAGTTRHQACNEIVETALALDALGWSMTHRAPSSTQFRA